MPENLSDEEKPLNPNLGEESSQATENVEKSEEIVPSENLIEENIETIAPPIEPLEPVATVAIPPRKPWIPSFHGEGSKYFVIRLINALIQVVTLNFYYPWAKAAKLDYLYEQTEFAGSRFKFHGSGKEMFIGYLKMLFIVAVIYGGFYWANAKQQVVLGFLILYGGLILVYPMAIHGTVKYRLSRTSWRGIFFGYRGEPGELFAKFFIGILLSIVTFSIYWSWVQVDLRKYVTQHVRFGDVEFNFTGKGLDLFLIKLKYMAFFFVGYMVVIFLVIIVAIGFGLSNFFKTPDMGGGLGNLSTSIIFGIVVLYLLVIAILGTIALMRQREIFQFYATHTFAWQNEQWHGVKLNMTFGDLFKLSVGNMFLLVFTLGIATPYVEVRNLHFIMPRLEIDATFDPDILTQTESDYRDATGEDVGDWLDIDLA
jgi:uncharacterized membrane protein YjgN (DUF898 family)